VIKVEKCFESFVGVLLHQSDTNRWNYKFTWAPRNVVLGKGTAKFIQEGTYNIPYCNLFRRTEFLEVEDYGRFEAYSNRFIEI
jgi:hypothetical protein